MKRNIISIIIVLLVVCILTFTGCQSIIELFNPIPDNYIDGIKYDRDFPDDILDLYDNIIVYEDDSTKKETAITAGSSDEIDDIRDFYLDFFRDNEVTVLEETDKRKEYSAVFELTGYMMEIVVTTPKGEYIEDLFESIITYSAKKLTDKQLAELYPTPTPVPTPEPTPTPLISNKKLEIDSYTSWWSTDDDLNEGDFNFTITSDTQGTMYYMNSSIPEMWKKDFEYIYIDDALTFNYEDGTKDDFTVSINEIGNLVLTSTDNPSLLHNCYRYSDHINTPLSANNYTATGSWYWYDSNENQIKNLSLWDNSLGAYYTSSTDVTEFIIYNYVNYNILLNFEDGPISYKVVHRGNILELQNDNDETLTFFMRANETVLVGTYELLSSWDENITKMNITLDYHGDLQIDIEGKDYTYYDQEGSWFINRTDGTLQFYNNDISEEYELIYDYHFSLNRLFLISKSNSDLTIDLLRTD